jgi:hypothetical protein
MQWVFFRWVDPYWWVAMSVCAFALAALGIGPLGHAVEAETHDVAAVATRRLVWGVAVMLLALIGAEWLIVRRTELGASFGPWWGSMGRHYGAALAAAAILGLLLRVAWYRFLVPRWSALLRRWRVRQEVDTLTDIREEFGRFEPKTYDPRRYYGNGKVFVGLNEHGKPVDLELALVRETHMQIVGPTRWGKGVTLCGVMEQMIRHGSGVWYFDPKGDQYAPAILADAAKKLGRPFYVLDFVECRGSGWAPFGGGTAEERAARVITAFKLEDGGSEADFYRRAERGLVREAIDTIPADRCSLSRLAAEFRKAKGRKFGSDQRAQATTAVEDGLIEWSAVGGAAVEPGQGVIVRTLVDERAVVYVRCRAMGVTREMARCLLHELTDCVLATEPGRRGLHVFCGIDEARSMISGPVVGALTTVAGAGMTMALAYQSRLDVANLDDKRLDGRVVSASIDVNCQIKVQHGVVDSETAEYVAELTGERRVLVAQLEETEVERFGAEKWGARRAFRADKEALISADTVRALPQRVPILIRPGRPAEIVFTSWLSFDRQAWIDATATPAPAPMPVDRQQRTAPAPKLPQLPVREKKAPAT